MLVEISQWEWKRKEAWEISRAGTSVGILLKVGSPCGGRMKKRKRGIGGRQKKIKKLFLKHKEDNNDTKLAKGHYYISILHLAPRGVVITPTAERFGEWLYLELL